MSALHVEGAAPAFLEHSQMFGSHGDSQVPAAEAKSDQPSGASNGKITKYLAAEHSAMLLKSSDVQQAPVHALPGVQPRPLSTPHQGAAGHLGANCIQQTHQSSPQSDTRPPLIQGAFSGGMAMDGAASGHMHASGGNLGGRSSLPDRVSPATHNHEQTASHQCPSAKPVEQGGQAPADHFRQATSPESCSQWRKLPICEGRAPANNVKQAARHEYGSGWIMSLPMCEGTAPADHVEQAASPQCCSQRITRLPICEGRAPSNLRQATRREHSRQQGLSSSDHEHTVSSRGQQDASYERPRKQMKLASLAAAEVVRPASPGGLKVRLAACHCRAMCVMDAVWSSSLSGPFVCRC